MAPLAQDWYETYSYNGIGNLRGTGIYLNLNNTRPDYMASEDYRPVGTGTNTLDRLDSVRTSVSAGTPAVTAGTTSYAYDLLGHLTKVTRTAGESESLYYAPGGELAWRQVGEKFVFYVGEYATVTARGAAGCGASCTPVSTSVELDAHVVFAGTRIASVKPSRTLYYYRTRLGSVIATSLGGGLPGAAYRYDAYGEVELVQNETNTTRSELGYTNALRLTGSLLHLKNRVYDTDARVFIQPDVVDRLRYAYVVGDPVNSSDPTGLKADQESPVVDARYSYDGAWVYVREERADGSTTYNAYDLSIPTDFAAFSRFQDQMALQKEQAIAEAAASGNLLGKIKAKVEGVLDGTREKAREAGAAAVSGLTRNFFREHYKGDTEASGDVAAGLDASANSTGGALGAAAHDTAVRAGAEAGQQLAGGVLVRVGVRFIGGVRILLRGGKVLEGTVDLAPTLRRIQTGGTFPHANDGSVFKNLEKLLPSRPQGYYREWVVPTPGVTGPGTQRIVTGAGGEIFYTPDHYKTFIDVTP